jgi:anti-sigma B factor antagonist
MAFTVRDDRTNPPHHIVRMTGDLDVATAPELRSHLLTLIEDGQAALTVDLDGLDFMDSSGIGVLLGALKRARTKDGEVTLICSNELLLTVLSITGLNSVFPIYDSVESLLAGYGVDTRCRSGERPSTATSVVGVYPLSVV